jgi:hypothetical protein
MRITHVVPAILLTLSLAPAACGGGSDEESAKRMLREYWTAIAERDGERACEMITERDRSVSDGSAVPCGELALALETSEGDPGAAKRLAAADYEVQIDGDVARAREQAAGCLIPPPRGWGVEGRPDDAVLTGAAFCFTNQPGR